jgi:hypothetical protein
MSTVTCHIAMSLDGYVSGRGQSRDAPFGDAGTRLHEWLFEIGEPGRESDAAVIEEVGDLALEQVKVVPSPTVTHIKYRVIH